MRSCWSGSQGISELKVSNVEMSKTEGQIFSGSFQQSLGGNGMISVGFHWMGWVIYCVAFSQPHGDYCC